MPGRKYVGESGYRYGFNGKENDNEVKGEGNQQDYGMRIHDPRLGRFLSVDPLTRSYPWYTPYQFAGNKPIRFVDRDGEEEDNSSFIKRAIQSFTNQVNSEVESIGRLASNQSGDANIPVTINGKPGPGGVARNIMAAYQKARDYENAANYLSRPYKITNSVASIVLPEAGAINGVYNISQGNYVSGGIDLGGAALGVTFRALSTTEQLTVNSYVKVVGNADEAANLINQGVRDFKALEDITVKSAAKIKIGNPSDFKPLEALRGKADSKQVAEIMKAMKGGAKMDPIDVYVNNGRMYVLDGHHRLEAASRLNRSIEYQEISLQRAMELYHYKDEVEILNAHRDAFMNSRLDNRLINKILNK